MLITIKQMNFCGVTFTVVKLCPFTNEKKLIFLFWFFNFGLPQPTLNLYTMLITSKNRSSLNVGGVTATILELCFFTNGKKESNIW